MSKHATRIASALIVSVLVATCAQSATPTTDSAPGTSTTSPDTTQPSPPTTTDSAVVDEAEGSGCTPGPGELGNGDWFGNVTATTDTTVEFDLACWFTGDAAARAAAEDGEESPPPNDYYVRNVNETLRTLEVSSGAQVIWYPQGGPTGESTTSYPDWIQGVEERGFMFGVWLEVEDGTVVSIHEQWVP